MKAQRRRSPPRPSHVVHALLGLSLVGNVLLAWRIFHPPAPPPLLELTGELKAFAALGTNSAEVSRFRDLKMTEAQFDAYVRGMHASLEGRGYPYDEDAAALHRRLNERVRALTATEQLDPTERYFQNLREKENVQRTSSNLHYRITLEGEGVPPTERDTVVVSYAARTPEGEKLDSLAGVRVRAQVTDLLPGLAEGVRLLKPGGKALVFVPAALSFGDGAWPKDVPRGMPIGFFLELHEVIAPQ